MCKDERTIYAMKYFTSLSRLLFSVICKICGVLYRKSHSKIHTDWDPQSVKME